MNKANPKKSVFFAALVLVGGILAGSGILAASSAGASDVAKVDRDAARDLFHGYSCSACHSLPDAGAGGSMGPTLQNPSFTREYLIDRIANGQGAMPAFGGQLSDEEIALLADYIVEVSHEDAK